ncbi:MFS transporter [Arhodomonas sp. AD133]|uniref:MFS transporter n=1 Tax=Arhodomonas sp. AD133 TaxID=3415009 RepID=UPI003EB7FA56
MSARALLTALFAYFSLYAPQPLLPRFAESLAVTESQIALLMSATLLPLGVAPLAYGAVLSRVSSARVLQFGTAGLGIAALVFAAVPSFPVMLGARLVQGLLLPAVMTALMTAVAGGVSAERLQRVMSAYVAATIVGGFGGRLLAGGIATWWDWRAFFVAMGLALIATGVWWRRAPRVAPAHRALPTMRAVRELWTEAGNGYLFSAIFCLFFVFVGLLNYLPFRVTQLSPQASELDISLLYAGYLMGIVSALAAHRVIRALGGRARAVTLGYAVYVLALAGTLVANLTLLFVVIFVFCGGMFLVHSIASAQVNRSESPHRGLINGLYVSAYYLGGVLGSYVPGLIYERWGWGPTIAGIGVVGLLGLTLAWRHGRIAPGATDSAMSAAPAQGRTR